MAFNEPTKHGHIATDSGYTYGGFSQRISVHQNFVIKIPDRFPLESAAACLTTGTSIYAPLKKFGALTKPKRVAVLGMGNMGMIGIRIAAVMGHEVAAMSVHENKESLAFELGADKFLSWAKAEDMKVAYTNFDIILNTLSGPHEVGTFLPMLDHNGTIVQLGLMINPHNVSTPVTAMYNDPNNSLILSADPVSRSCASLPGSCWVREWKHQGHQGDHGVLCQQEPEAHPGMIS